MAMEGTKGVITYTSVESSTTPQSVSAIKVKTVETQKKTQTTSEPNMQTQAQTQLKAQNQDTKKAIKEAIDKLNENLIDTRCEYGIDDETNRITIKVVDTRTKKILKEYPPEETLDMIAKVWEIAGINIDKKL